MNCRDILETQRLVRRLTCLFPQSEACTVYLAYPELFSIMYRKLVDRAFVDMSSEYIVSLLHPKDTLSSLATTNSCCHLHSCMNSLVAASLKSTDLVFLVGPVPCPQDSQLWSKPE